MFCRFGFGLYCRGLLNGERFALQSVGCRVGAGSAGDGPLAISVYGTECDGDAMLIEPLGDLAVSPVLAAQCEDGFTMRLQLAARSALRFVFG